MSDLHLYSWDEDKRQFREIKNLLKYIRTLASNDVFWWPDYIVLAGDVIQYKKGIERATEYQNAEKVIDYILKQFHLDKSKVIITPGNHDKDYPEINNDLLQKIIDYDNNIYSLVEDKISSKDKDIIDKQKEIDDNISELSKLCNNNQESGFDFDNKFGESFRPFYDFYGKYINENNYFYPDKLLNKKQPLYSTFGLKVFENHKVCFLTINTELTYTPKNSHNSEIMRLVKPLIYPLIQKIRDKYPQYTVVTVMHRDPRESSWKERNGKNVSIIEELYECSDVILTGHEHPEKWLVPHMMSNSAQLFKLGSSSMESRNPYSPLEHFATLIKIDSMAGSVQYKQLLQKSNNEWTETNPVLSTETVPLRNKFGKFDKYVPANRKGLFTIFSQSHLKSDIDQAICRVFNCSANNNDDRQLLTSIYCDITNEKIKDSIDEKKTLLVLYADPNCYKVMMDRANGIRKKFMKDIISMRLIVCTAILKVPYPNCD